MRVTIHGKFDRDLEVIIYFRCGRIYAYNFVYTYVLLIWPSKM